MERLNLPKAWIITSYMDECVENGQSYVKDIPIDAKERDLIYVYDWSQKFLISENEVNMIYQDEDSEEFNEALLIRKSTMKFAPQLTLDGLVRSGILPTKELGCRQLHDLAIIKLKSIFGDTSYEQRFNKIQQEIKSDLRINLAPSVEEFQNAIYQLESHGFNNGRTEPHDREEIVNAFDRKGFVVLYYKQALIGFTTWKKHRNTGEIQYKWILPKYRGFGIGKLFSELLFLALRKKRIYNLVAVPASVYGKAMARTMGFVSLEETPYKPHRDYYYKLNKKGRTSKAPTNVGYELSIWAKESHNPAKSCDQCYTLDENLNKTPILTIVDWNSLVVVSKDGKELKRGIVKRFFTEYKEFQYFGFLYISTPLSKFLHNHNITT